MLLQLPRLEQHSQSYAQKPAPWRRRIIWRWYQHAWCAMRRDMRLLWRIVTLLHNSQLAEAYAELGNAAGFADPALQSLSSGVVGPPAPYYQQSSPCVPHLHTRAGFLRAARAPGPGHAPARAPPPSASDAGAGAAQRISARPSSRLSLRRTAASLSRRAPRFLA